MGSLFGGINGALTGMTGPFVVPDVVCVPAIGLPRDLLVPTIGLLFSVSTATLAVSPHANDLLTM